MRQQIRAAKTHAQISPSPQPLIRLSGLGKTYDTPAGPFPALTDIDLEVAEGDFLAIVGKSGSGKSTLINVITGIDTPSAGQISVAGADIGALSEDQMAAWRGVSVGVVFQFFQLLPTLTVAENVMLPMDFCNTFPPASRRARAQSLLDRLEIGTLADKLPSDISGGQQQRAAIARALANDPPIIVADEPTGNLDSRTSDEVLALFQSLANEGKAVVMVTHERDVSNFVSHIVELDDGRIAARRSAEAAT